MPSGISRQTGSAPGRAHAAAASVQARTDAASSSASARFLSRQAKAKASFGYRPRSESARPSTSAWSARSDRLLRNATPSAVAASAAALASAIGDLEKKTE